MLGRLVSGVKARRTVEPLHSRRSESLSTEALIVVDVKRLTDRVEEDWKNFELARVNDHVVRCSVLDRDFHWHVHDTSDEAFLLLEGTLLIDLDDRTIRLGPAQMVTVPRGTRHRTRAEGRVINLTFEHRETCTAGNGSDGGSHARDS